MKIFGGIMKLKAKYRILSAALAVIMLFTACGNTAATPGTELESTENSQVTIEKDDTNVVTTPSEGTEEEEPIVEVEPEPTPEELEQQEWQKYMMPNVENYLNVRVEPNVDAGIAGKLEKGDRAEILEPGAEWTKIQSGNLVGYVSNQYCLFASEALAYAKANCRTIATTTTDGLRIREEQSTDSKIIKRLDEGDKLVVDTSADTIDGWVAVRHNDCTYYVSADYVTVEIEVGTGLTNAEIEEIAREEARKAQEEAERKAREEQARKEAAEKVARDNNALSEVDDLTLMAAIIYCEAGAEPYETQLAVGAVIVNRMHSARFGGTLFEVLSRPGQFTPYRTGKLAKAVAESKAKPSCYDAARAALAGEDNTNGCLFFNDYNGTKEGIRYGGMVFWW